MKIVRSVEEGIDTFVLDDRFDAHEVAPFKAAVTPVVRPGTVVGLDLSAVRFIDSSALAELLRLRKALDQFVPPGGQPRRLGRQCIM